MDVRELMHAPAVTCEPSVTLREAARRLSDERIGTLLVVDHHGRLLGIVTDRDLAVHGLGEGLGPDAPVASVMSSEPTVVHGYDDVFIAASEMASHAYRRLPVVDRDHHLEGVIALDDLMLLFVEQLDKVARTLRDQQEQ